MSSRIHLPATRSYYVQFTQQMYIRTKIHRTYTEQDDCGTIDTLEKQKTMQWRYSNQFNCTVPPLKANAEARNSLTLWILKDQCSVRNSVTPNPIHVIQFTHVDLLRFDLEYLTPTPTAQFSFNRRTVRGRADDMVAAEWPMMPHSLQCSVLR